MAKSPRSPLLVRGQPHSGRKQLRVPPADGRSADKVFIRQIREELAAHIGGSPSLVQQALIDRAAWLRLHLRRMDQAALETGGMTDHRTKQYIVAIRAYSQLLAALDVQSPDKPPLTLASYLNGRAPETAA